MFFAENGNVLHFKQLAENEKRIGLEDIYHYQNCIELEIRRHITISKLYQIRK